MNAPRNPFEHLSVMLADAHSGVGGRLSTEARRRGLDGARRAATLLSWCYPFASSMRRSLGEVAEAVRGASLADDHALEGAVGDAIGLLDELRTDSGAWPDPPPPVARCCRDPQVRGGKCCNCDTWHEDEV